MKTLVTPEQLKSKIVFVFMKSILARLNSPFPYYLNDDRKNTFLVFVVTIFLFFYLVSIHIDYMPDKLFKMLLICMISFVVLLANIVWLPHLAPVLFDSVTWTLKKYLIFNAWQLLIIGVTCCSLFSVMDFYPGCDIAGIYLHFFPRLIAFGSIPVLLVTFYLKSYQLKETLRDAIHANRELEKIKVLKTESIASVNSLTIFSDTSETLNLKLPDLLFVEANDNYSTFYWMNGHGLEKKMLRVNLKNVESQLNNSFTLRCHRSFIVNINKIAHISGNTNGYKLNILNTELTIPVSRTKGKEVIEKIEQLRNMAEVS